MRVPPWVLYSLLGVTVTGTGGGVATMLTGQGGVQAQERAAGMERRLDAVEVRAGAAETAVAVAEARSVAVTDRLDRIERAVETMNTKIDRLLERRR